MGLLDYIFKSKEQREKEAKEAEEKKDRETFSKADRLRKEGKDDEALELYMQLVNKRYRGTGFWYVYINACSILWKQKRYPEILNVVKNYDRWYDRDADASMSQYESWAKMAIKEQEAEKKKPKVPIQPIPKPAPKPVLPKPAQQSTKTTTSANDDLPDGITHITYDEFVAQREKKKEYKPEDAFDTAPLTRVIRYKQKADTLGYKYRMAKKKLPKYTFMTSDISVPFEAKQTLLSIEAEAQKLLYKAEEYYRKKEIKKAAEYYEELVSHLYWKPEPYVALIAMYEEAGRHEEAQAVRQSGINNLSSVQRGMKIDLLEAAKEIDAEDLAQEMINNGEKVEYNMGLFTLYDPFPCIEQWRQELIVNA